MLFTDPILLKLYLAYVTREMIVPEVEKQFLKMSKANVVMQIFHFCFCHFGKTKKEQCESNLYCILFNKIRWLNIFIDYYRTFDTFLRITCLTHRMSLNRVNVPFPNTQSVKLHISETLNRKNYHLVTQNKTWLKSIHWNILCCLFVYLI